MVQWNWFVDGAAQRARDLQERSLGPVQMGVA